MRQVVQKIQECAAQCILKFRLIFIPQLLNQVVLNLLHWQPLAAVGAVLISGVCFVIVCKRVGKGGGGGADSVGLEVSVLPDLGPLLFWKSL
jgi:hypothetical protein